MKILSAKNKNAVQLAAKALEKGGTVIFPTETAYGLGAIATNKKAVEKVFELKGRPRQKALPIIASNLAVIERYALLDDLARHLAKALMPGPLTLVVQSKDTRLSAVSAEDGSVAFRIPGGSFARRLCSTVGKLIVATSANPSGGKTPYSVDEIEKSLLEKVNAVVDAGTLPCVPPSTILDVRGKAPAVLRKGPVSPTAIFREVSAFKSSGKKKKIKILR